MPRIYKKRTAREEMDKDKINSAVIDVLKGTSYRNASAAHGVKMSTLYFYVKKAKKGPLLPVSHDDSGQDDFPELCLFSEKGRFKASQIFTPEQELMLETYILTVSYITLINKLLFYRICKILLFFVFSHPEFVLA